MYIDDNPENAAAATALGMHGIHFTSPDAFRTELIRLGLLGDDQSWDRGSIRLHPIPLSLRGWMWWLSAAALSA